MRLFLKRVYDDRSDGDGMRVLVDRLWPRGLSKAEAAIDLWAKDIAPSTELRHWYHSNMEDWPEFRKRYRQELKDNGEAVAELRKSIGKGPATLLFSTHVDPERSNAAILRDVLAGD
jgi:uncharacterized protein YeaO (DUF488 family)